MMSHSIRSSLLAALAMVCIAVGDGSVIEGRATPAAEGRTIAGSQPVMIHDDQFRFDVNLVTGSESGTVLLVDQIAGPKVRCALNVVGTGLNGSGNPTFNYSGECTFRGE